MNGDELFKKLQKKKANRERKSLTIYFSRPLFERFRQLCDDREVSASAAIEQLVRDFMDNGGTPEENGQIRRLKKLLEESPGISSLLDDFLSGIESGKTSFKKSKAASRRTG